MAISAGANVLVLGRGPVMLLAAKLAALRGYSTTVAVAEDYKDAKDAPKLIFGAKNENEDIPLIILPASPSTAGFDPNVARAAIAAADAVIIAFDDDNTVDDSILNTWVPQDRSGAKHISFMSRYLNGKGMGPIAAGAKLAGNMEIWAARPPEVAKHKAADQAVVARANALGASYTIIRAGTLKGGGSGGVTNGGNGDARFLDPFIYDPACESGSGTTDFINWKLLFDCETLGVKLVGGDTLPGPGFTAALSSISEKACEGDSGRGGVAEALVEALACESAANGDFSVGTAEGKSAPSREEWATMFASAARG